METNMSGLLGLYQSHVVGMRCNATSGQAREGFLRQSGP